MTMIALRKFTVYVKGKPTIFRRGDKLPDSVVKECNLASKPDMAAPIKSTSEQADKE